ncbi:MAG TPA: hypothetical protein VFB03_00535 [Candidatus Saccharimonadales bacterium]|nr:hypothetical protein [Candidatus Saccharimonadales bacterium]
MSDIERVTVRINPQNRLVDINDPGYQKNWVSEFEKLRSQREKELAEAVRAGEIEIQANPHDPRANTVERAIHLHAHAAAEQDMKDWAVLGGIGMVGADELSDHGRVIQYVDDTDVPVFGHVVVEESKAA